MGVGNRNSGDKQVEMKFVILLLAWSCIAVEARVRFETDSLDGQLFGSVFVDDRSDNEAGNSSEDNSSDEEDSGEDDGDDRSLDAELDFSKAKIVLDDNEDRIMNTENDILLHDRLRLPSKVAKSDDETRELGAD